MNKYISNVNSIDEGRIVKRYNIAKALIECYFIPSDKKKDYDIAVSKQDLGANIKYGTQILMTIQLK